MVELKCTIKRNGKRKTLRFASKAEAAKFAGLPYSVFSMRLQDGWPLSRALTQPMGHSTKVKPVRKSRAKKAA